MVGDYPQRQERDRLCTLGWGGHETPLEIREISIQGRAVPATSTMFRPPIRMSLTVHTLEADWERGQRCHLVVARTVTTGVGTGTISVHALFPSTREEHGYLMIEQSFKGTLRVAAGSERCSMGQRNRSLQVLIFEAEGSLSAGLLGRSNCV
jgi:hypothetical protein